MTSGQSGARASGARDGDAASPLALAPGQRLTDYEVLGALGAGGMGELYRARDTRLQREVALKVLPEALAEDVQTLRRFELEARTLAALNHPNISLLHDVDQEGDLCFLVLELIEGEDLARRAARGAVPVPEALRIARAVAEALAAAHRAGIVHRDLKPANVMVGTDGTVKVIDFGLAKHLCLGAHSGIEDSGPISTDGRLLGTVDYMAPEQARGESVDARADLWAFGCIVYELLSGARIFPAASVTAKLAALATDAPDWERLPAETPGSVRLLLERCLEKDPDGRSLDAAEAARLLEGELGQGARSATLSVAVLPIEGGSNADDEYLCDGITEELLLALGRLPGLQVAARSSSFVFKGQRVDARTVGQRLGVERVLEGSLRRAGDRVRISVRLVDADSGLQLWAERFELGEGDIFDLQDAVAGAVAEALRGELGPAGPARWVPCRTRDIEAYEHHLEGRFFLEQRGAALSRAAEAFQAALDLDPALAVAHAGLAEALALRSYYGTRRPHEAMPPARAAAERALELDPGLAEAHTALGWIQLMYDWDTEAARRSFREALRLEPRSVQARLWYGGYVIGLFEGHVEEGLALCREAVQLDPLSIGAWGQLAVAMNFVRRPADALETIAAAPGDHPTAYMLWFHRGVAHFNLERYAEAQADLEHAVSLSGSTVWAKALLAATLVRRGDAAGARALEEQLELEHRAGFVSPACRALIPAARGQGEEVLGLVEEAVAERDGILRVLPVWTVLDPFRDDARFRALVERSGSRS